MATFPTADGTAKADTTITIGAETGSTILPLLGVNVGPVPAGDDPANADVTAEYRDIGVRLIRIHGYYGPLDMSAMYPDLSRDPASPSSYSFAESDRVWRAIADSGSEPYFRLGDSYGNVRPPTNSAERTNWEKAAMEVLRHYRTGKWNGFSTPFRYVEIWNEPDYDQFWPKPLTALDYYQLYTETSTKIRQQFPDLKVGGPVVTQYCASTPQGKKWVGDFLDYVKTKNAPLDFFSFHMYSNDPSEYAEAARFYRSELDARGFTSTELHITEYNTNIKRDSDTSAETMALRTGSMGAAIMTASWIGFQDNKIDGAFLYRGTDTTINLKSFYGMFYADGRPKKSALAFSLWSKMSAYPERLATSPSPDTSLYLLAGRNSAGTVALLIANPSDKTVNARITMPVSQKSRGITRYVVSDASDQVQKSIITSTVTEVGPYSVQMLVME
jgi:hypothetical protein